MSSQRFAGSSGPNQPSPDELEAAEALCMLAQRPVVGSVLTVKHPAATAITDILAALKIDDNLPEDFERYVNDPLPGHGRPSACTDTDHIPEALREYVQTLTLVLASTDVILGIWVHMWNVLGIKISFPVLCAICEIMIKQAPAELKVRSDVPPEDQENLRVAMYLRLKQCVLALHLWATSEDGMQARQAQAEMLGQEFDADCSERALFSLGVVWNGLVPQDN